MMRARRGHPSGKRENAKRKNCCYLYQGKLKGFPLVCKKKESLVRECFEIKFLLMILEIGGKCVWVYDIKQSCFCFVRKNFIHYPLVGFEARDKIGYH